jgi:Family of unknown function (DUF6236)
MVSYFGLYYPFIHFKDEGWLKLTALYWDGMKRIVPMGAGLHDSDEVKRLIDVNFVQDESPTDAAASIAPTFRDLIAVHGDTLRARLGIAGRAEWVEDPFTRLYAPSGSDTRLAYVFDEKIDQRLLSDLFTYELVTERTGNARWIGMHPRLANLYMISLAEAMAPVVGAYPLTDEAFDHIAVSGLTMERLAAALLEEPALAPERDEREIEEHMASLALGYVVPAAPADIPAARIVAFREQYAEERSLFQAEVAKLATSLAYLDDVTDIREVERHLQNEYDKTLARRLQRLRKSLKRAGFDTVESTIGTSFAIPAGLAAALAAAGLTLAPPVSAALGIAVGAWTIWRKHRSSRDNLLKPSPEAYLYQASKFFTPESLTGRISVDSRRFAPYSR